MKKMVLYKPKQSSIIILTQISNNFMDFIKIKYEVLTFVSKIKEIKYRNIDKSKTTNSLVKLKKIDNRTVLGNSREIRLFGILRNESLRLPYFFQHYKQMGVDRFFLIDNNSVDNSSAIILKEDKTHLFFTNESYMNHWQWMEYLLETFGKNHWCIVVDIDELFYYPNFDIMPLPSLIKYLEKYKFTSISTLLLDMYADNNILEIEYKETTNPLEVLPFFDTEYYKTAFVFYDNKKLKPFQINAYAGGMRERVFGKMNPTDILSKVPLFKYSDDVYLVQGMHAITNTNPADIEGVVFHTKFLSDFIGEVQEEVSRKQHYGNAIRYEHYAKTIDKQPKLNFYYEKSKKFKDANQLVELGLMKTSNEFEGFC
jgi:hypothetical protein